MKLIPEVLLKNILCHLKVFKYASHSADQVEKLIIQNEAELNRDNKIDPLRFLSYVGMAAMVAILLLICYCFCKKCNLLRRFLDDYCVAESVCTKWS
jgi:hypothetical protein